MQKEINLCYNPKSFCKEYVGARKDSSLLIQFMAVVLGIKKSYDDWFPLNEVERVKEMCRKYGIHCKFDWIFSPCEDVSKVVSGGSRLPTTKMFGFPFNEKSVELLKESEDARVHVFFSKSKEDVELSFRNGWYPLVINNRAIHKPYIDMLRFGYFLGYPDCCIDFFRRYNNYALYNHLFEILRNTKKKPNFFCNPLMKNDTFSYIYHMPCSYNCKSTISYVSRLRKGISEQEPKLVERTDEMLLRPFLVFKEQISYVFEGQIKENCILYSKFAFIGKDEEIKNNMLLERIREGNRLKVEDKEIIAYKDNEEIYKQKKETDEGFILKFYG